MIRVGIGGWTYAPWRGEFYPKGVTQKNELAYASRAVTTIEVNGTYYATQKPDSFRKWAQETPDDFVFALKAHKLTTNRKILASAGPSIEHFIGSGITELGKKLGPILWQLAPTKQFDAADVDAFCALLPHEANGLALRHVLDVRHPTFRDAAFVEIARRHSVAVCIVDSEKFPLIADPTAPFVYVRLLGAQEEIATGYPQRDIETWARRLKTWEGGKSPEDLPQLAPVHLAGQKRDCFLYMINGAKVRAPAAAKTMLRELGLEPAAPDAKAALAVAKAKSEKAKRPPRSK